MERGPRTLFWVELVFAATSLVIAGLTIMWPDWIELVFKVDPDGGNGSLEWTVVVVAAMLSLVAGLLARSDWKKVAQNS